MNGDNLTFNDNIHQAKNESCKQNPDYKIFDTVYAWISLLVGFLFVKTLPVNENTTGAILFLILLSVFAVAYFKHSKIKKNAASALVLTLILVLSLGFITGANTVIQKFLYLFLVWGFLYWIYFTVGLSGKSLVGENFFLHGFNSVFLLPIKSLKFFFGGIIIKDKNGLGKKAFNKFLWALLGLWIAIIPTGIVIALLSYDDGFIGILEKIIKYIGNSFFDVIFGAVSGAILFSALFGAKHQRNINEGGEEKVKGINTKVLPEALLCAGVTPVLLVYVIFFISQWKYYISAFTGVLPEGLSYAEYAREGFFQLCIICVINAFLLLFYNLFMKCDGKISAGIKKGYSVVISLFTLVLIATALSKMVLYIGSYGLTQKRVYASWLMVLMAVIFLVVVLKLFVKRIPLVKISVLIFVVFFALIAIPNVDGMIAKYNVDHYISGELETVDIDTISEYGVSGVPALVKLKEHINAKNTASEYEGDILSKTNGVLSEIKENIENEKITVFNFNLPMFRARKALASYN